MITTYAKNHIHAIRLIRFISKYTDMDYNSIGRIAEAVAFGAIEPNEFDYSISHRDDRITIQVWRKGQTITLKSTCFSDEIDEAYPNQHIRTLTEQVADGVGVE